MIQKFITEN